MEVTVPPNNPIDAHCHLFNVFYLTGEISEILWDVVWGKYPLRTEAPGALPGTRAESIWGWFRDLKSQISELCQSAFGSYEDNFSMLTKAYQQTFGTTEQLVVYPLMMDIHYMAAKPFSEYVKPASKDARVAPVKDPKKLFDDLFGELKEAVVQRARELEPARPAPPKDAPATFGPDDIRQKLDAIYGEITSCAARMLRMAATAFGFKFSNAFARQVKELLALRQAHPDLVFPFFAVDPRRAGIMDVITKGKHFLPTKAPLVSRNGPFFGIKLYPRLGYLPMDVETGCPGLYKLCQDQDIPITVHCGMGGFPPGQNSGYGEYGNPENWKTVLAAYPRLRINFAHFGNKGEGWKQTIVSLMNGEENKVYTDLACYTEEAELIDAKAAMAASEVLKGRLMFGTDFDVMLTTDFVDLEDYFKHFKTVFADGDSMEDMSRRVPSLFLNTE
jgi:predicted TIM-barrel fold metal-dependent hydrolase